MNEFDKTTIEWLLQASKQELYDFYKELDTEDILHILQVLTQTNIELTDIGLEEPQPIEDFTEAKQVLSKFRLNK